ncbi:MAG: hypothetical protein LYZ70_01615 [Nitrososphaerales archaeon]|nr:hypothetical protein [Nitrososphaerales archaeon]
MTAQISVYRRAVQFIESRVVLVRIAFHSYGERISDFRRTGEEALSLILLGPTLFLELRVLSVVIRQLEAEFKLDLFLGIFTTPRVRYSIRFTHGNPVTNPDIGANVVHIVIPALGKGLEETLLEAALAWNDFFWYLVPKGSNSPRPQRQLAFLWSYTLGKIVREFNRQSRTKTLLEYYAEVSDPSL